MLKGVGRHIFFKGMMHVIFNPPWAMGPGIAGHKYSVFT